MKKVPLKLSLLKVGPLEDAPKVDDMVSVVVDARTTASELRHKLYRCGQWPESLDRGEILAALDGVIGRSNMANDAVMFPDAHPAEEPPFQMGVVDLFVVELPKDRWAVIDGIDHTAVYTEDNYGAAVCAAWDHYANTGCGDYPADVYAYYGLSLETPRGYEVYHETSDHGVFWVWDNGEPCDPGFNSRLEANIAAWRDKHFHEDDPVKTSGYATTYAQLHDGLSDMVESGRLTEAEIPEDYHWLVESLVHLGNKEGTERRGFDDIEIATVLDALRHYQQCTDEADRQDSEITGPVGHLSNDAIDALCERINFGDF